MSLAKFKSLFEKEKAHIFNDYFTFLRFASIATDPIYKNQVLKCADWLVEYLEKSGFTVEKWQTDNAPVIYASDLRAGQDKETLLFYCHYDVQPIDPLEEWLSPPFEPTVREQKVYARGASDNKGQCFYTIAALKAFLQLEGSFPINIKFIIEGEEESGSLGLSRLLTTKKDVLKAEHLLIVDSGLNEPNIPAITLGARGIVCLQATLFEADHDLHSGMVGGLAYNPNRALAELLSKLHDAEGRITIPGFYDDISDIKEEEKKEINFDFNFEQFRKTFSFLPTGMEKGLSHYECCWLRPTVEINGMWGGYTGAGFKTVIPAKANAKISCRLVPHQDPEKIAQSLSDYLIKNTPAGLNMTVERMSGRGRGFRTNPHSRIAKLMAQCYTEIFQMNCRKILIGGSIPIAVELAQAAQAEMVLVGVGLGSDLIHAPNEHFDLDRFEKGFLTICRTIELFH